MSGIASVIMNTGAITGLLSPLVLVFSMVFFALHRKKYERLISLYRQQGLPLSAQNNLMSFLGHWGSFFLAVFFKRVLDGRPVNIAPKQPLPPEAYAFVASQPRELTGWIRVHYYIYIICYGMFTIGIALFLLGKYWTDYLAGQ